MPTGSKPTFCLDSNVFLAGIVPEVTRAPRDDIRGAERLLRALQRGEIAAVTSVMALAEIRWVFAREQKPGFEIARATLEEGFAEHLTILLVDADLAINSATFRRRYYSKSNPLSHNHGIFPATAVRAAADALVTTDPDLLHVSELSVHRPSAFPAGLRPGRT